jgi:hypothetical protein
MKLSRRLWILSTLLFFLFLPCLVPRLVHPVTKMFGEDFNVYYTAALVARQHGGALIYEGADDGVDPQLRESLPNGVFLRTARSVGIPRIQLYVYPPTLADGLIPLTFFSRPVALGVWNLLNLLAVVLATVCILDLLRIPVFTWQSGLLLLCVFIATPTQGCLAWGQVTVLLLLLWSAGVAAYRRGWVNASAALFALAAAVKLTPCIVVLLFLLWRDWKWLRAFAVMVAVLTAAICAINTPHALGDYFTHVMPSMSRSIPSFANLTLSSSAELMWASMHGTLVPSMVQHVPDTIQARAKTASTVVLLAACVGMFFLRKVNRPEHRALALSSLAALSVAISPVSWSHAYTILLLPLSILWISAFQTWRSWTSIAMLTVCTAAFPNPVLFFLIGSLSKHVTDHGVFLSLMTLSFPCSALVLAFLCQRRAFRGVTEPSFGQKQVQESLGLQGAFQAQTTSSR